MAHSGKDKGHQVIEGQVLSACPSRLPRLRLGSIREIKRELVKLYADTRHGRIATQDASRLTFMLQALASLIKDSELETRVTKLEQQQK